MQLPERMELLHGLLVVLTITALSGIPQTAWAQGDRQGLSPHLPHDVPPDATPADFEKFSWQSFVALNWPADVDGEPLPGPIGTYPTALRVWQYYPTPEAVFLPDGRRPTLGSGEPIPPACRRLLAAEGLEKPTRVVRMTSKGSQVIAGVNADLEAIVNRPLIDQNLNFIVAEIRLNPDEFEYIVSHRFYDAGVQEALTADSISLPEGRIGGEVGAVEIKAAWRFLDPERDRDLLGRYYVERAPVYVHPQNTLDGEPLCVDALLGLVGFHISHKTESRPEWIWSTFEQVDNVRRGPGLPPNRTPTLRDPRCNSRYMCPVNQVPPSPFGWNSVAPYALEVPATQVVRTIEIPPFIRRLNQIWQDRLRRVAPDSVWQYYELIGTQWPAEPSDFDADQLNFGDPTPTVLSNSTMETYIQPTSSCIGCHGGRAHLADNFHTFPDFTFLLAHACHRLEREVTLLHKPCAALVLGTVGQTDPPIRGIEIDPGVRLASREIAVTRAAGTFELRCRIEPLAAAGDVDLAISTAPGAVPFATGVEATARHAGPNRFPLRPPGSATPATQPVSFLFHNRGSSAVSVGCTVEPL